MSRLNQRRVRDLRKQLTQRKTAEEAAVAAGPLGAAT